MRSVWGEAYQQQGHYIHVYISQLRRKLAEVDPAGSLNDLVLAEPGVGYRVRGGWSARTTTRHVHDGRDLSGP